MRRIERGKSATPLPIALRIVRSLDPERGAAAGMIWLSIVGCGLGPQDRDYLLRILPVLAVRECSTLSGPALLLRQGQLEELNAALRACLDCTEGLLAKTSASQSAAIAGADLVRKRLVPADRLIDLFEGDTRGVRLTAMKAWLADLHPALVVHSGSRKFIWHLTPIWDGRTAQSALRSLRSPRGRGCARVSPQAWTRYVGLQLGPEARGATSAFRIVRLEAARNGWDFAAAPSTLQHRMKALYKDLPELAFKAGKP